MSAGASANTVWTVGSLLNWTESYFREKALESPRLDAQILLSHVLKCGRPDLYVRYEEVPSDETRIRLRELIKKRLDGMPVAYIVGRKEFFLAPLKVNPAVLIPRPATETLVTAANEFLKGRDSPRILDIGTGSGCIAVAIALRNPSATVVATDISADALVIANENASANLVRDRIEFRRGDVYAPVQVGESFDVILSNPPYIPAMDIELLSREVRDFEPRTALDGGADGFAIIARVIAGAEAHLRAAGRILLEIGAGQAEHTAKLFDAAGLILEKVLVDGDRIPRVAIGRKA